MLGRLHDERSDVWVEGGWGIDALLGEQTRAHDDLDLGVRFEDVERICTVLGDFRRRDVEWPSSFILEDANGRKVDCHPLRFDENGDGWQANNLGGPPYRWPREGLEGVGQILGLPVPCITPELQVAWHQHEGFDDVDWQDMQHLADRFGLDLPERCLARPGFVHDKRKALN